jgi:hypothetical protein
MPPYDSPAACISALCLIGFSERPADYTGATGVSRFSRMEFLCMPGVFDSAGPLRTRAIARSRIAFWSSDTIGVLEHAISELHTQPTDAPVQRFKCGLTTALAWLGARVDR